MQAYIQFGDSNNLPMCTVAVPVRYSEWPTVSDLEVYFDLKWRVVRDNGKEYSIMYDRKLMKVVIDFEDRQQKPIYRHGIGHPFT